MPKKKPRPVKITTNPEEINTPLNDALINPQDVEGNTNMDAVNYEPGIGWVQPKPLKELIRRNKETRK